MCVVVTPERFENVKDVLLYSTTTLSCSSSPDTNIIWYYQQIGDDFQHGLYFGSSPAEIAVGDQYQIHTNAPGEHTLQIKDVTETENTTGLYTCRNRVTQTVIDNVMLNVIRKYNCMSFLSHFQNCSAQVPDLSLFFTHSSFS